MNRAAALLIALALTLPVLAGAAPRPVTSEPLTIQRGDVYPADRLRATPLMGVRLGMTLAEADRILLAAGFELRFRHSYDYQGGQRADGNHMFFRAGQHLQLDYLGDGGGGSIVVSLETMIQIAEDDPRTPQDWRDATLAAFGQPSWWQRWIDDRVLRDRMVYVSAPAMLDEAKLQQAWSCSIDWACPLRGDPQDCRSAVRRAGGPVLEVAFGPNYVRYAWTDYDAAYGALMRSDAFRRQDRSGLACPIPSVH